jgi:altronate dehydratase
MPMKLLLSTLVLIFIFSGCSTKRQNHRLRTKNAQQSAIIQQQTIQINTLKRQLKLQKIAKRTAVKPYIKKIKSPLPYSNSTIPKAPKKVIKLKKVEDTNYSSNYMYPAAKKKQKSLKKVVKNTVSKSTSNSTVPATQSLGMTKAECISMIGADKFSKYTQMFGSESASIKRCKMLKAMKH